MTAKDAPHDGAELNLDNITSLSADGCARPGGRSNYTPPDSGFAGYDDESEAAKHAAPKIKKFVDTGLDGYDDDPAGPATIDLISRMRGEDEGGDDDRPAA